MTANYKLVKNLSARKSDGKVLYHARYVPEKTVRTDELTNQVRERTALSPADLKAALQVLQDLIVDSLSNGRNVELEGIGTFSVVLAHRPLEDKKVRAESIHFRDVHFRSSSKLRERLQHMLLRRVDAETPSVLTDAEREERTLSYLQDHPYITGREYASLNECGRTKASADLRRMLEKGRLQRKRFGGMWLYSI